MWILEIRGSTIPHGCMDPFSTDTDPLKNVSFAYASGTMHGIFLGGAKGMDSDLGSSLTIPTLHVGLIK